MDLLRSRLDASEGRFLIMDGGMGTTLEDRGTNVRTAIWSSLAGLSPDGRALVREIHAEFVAAGAGILLANTHNLLLDAAREYVEETGGGDPEEILIRGIRVAVEDARAAATGRCLVGAGLGSVEGPYATRSSHSVEECAEGLRPSVRAAVAAGIDLLVFETLTTREEILAAAAIGGAGEAGAFAAGLTCGADGRTLAGVPVPEAARVLLGANPAALFVQCTAFDVVLPALRELFRAAGDATLVGVYANDGRTWEGRRWHGERTSPEDYAAAARRWIDEGARIVGGCCGTGPEHIRALVSLC